MMWLYGCAFGAAVLFVGLGFAAFWPVWPPVEPGVHRAKRQPRKARVAVLDEKLEEAGDTEEWIWTTEGQLLKRPRHRYENIGEGTQALRWHERPTGPQPIHPPDPPIE